MKILVIDSGGFHVSTSKHLAALGHEVLYFTPSAGAYPEFKLSAPGFGCAGLTRVIDFGYHLGEADLIFFPDVGYGGLAASLRVQGKKVFGAGLGEVMEQDRGRCMEILTHAGLSCPETAVVHGVSQALDKLRSLIMPHDETNQSASGAYFVKIDVWRGSFDSFPVESLEQAQFMFDKLTAAFGPYAESIPITIQKTIQGVEYGADLVFNGSRFVGPHLIGFESGGSYVGYVSDDLGPFEQDMKKLETVLNEMNYRGNFSFECIFDGQRNHYIDITCRFPYPLGLLFPAFTSDFGEFVAGIASGDLDSSLLPRGKFLGCMEVRSEDGKTDWLALQGGKRTWFSRYIEESGKPYHVPGTTTVAACLVEGDTMKDVERQFLMESEDLNIFFAESNPEVVSDIRSKYIEPLRKMGWDFDQFSHSAEGELDDSAVEALMSACKGE